MDKVRQKAAVEEKKKDDDLKKKEEVSKKLEDEKPGNLLVSVVRKVIKEEQNDSSMEVETDNKEGFKDIVRAADDFASKVGSGKKSRQRQNPQGKRERKFPQKRNIADQKQEQGKSQG